MKKFYYSRYKLLQLLLLNAVLFGFMLCFQNCCPCYKGLADFVTLLVGFSFVISLIITIFPPRVALLDKEGIIIDRNALLKWSDIKKAEKLEVRACLFKRAIIRLEPKKGKGKPWRLMQYVSQGSAFGAYSVPLYAMSPKDAETIEKAIKKFIKIQG